MKRFRFQHRSLIFRLLMITAAAAMFPALVISIAQQSIGSHALQASIEREQTEVARRVAEEVNEQIRQAQRMVALIARSSFFTAGSRVDQYEALRNLLHDVPALQETMFVSGQGEELVKVSAPGARPGLVPKGVRLRESYIGPAFFAGNRAPTVLLAEPVRTFANPTRAGAVLAKLSFTSLNELMRESRIGARGIAFIVNEKGMLLAHPDLEKVLNHTTLADLPVVKNWMANPEHPTPLQEYTDARHESMMALAYPIPLLRSAVIVEQPRADVYATLLRMRYQFVVWSLVSLAVFLSIALFIGWRILQPLRQLRAAVDQVGRGENDIQLNIKTQDELEELGRAFEAMAKSLAQLERMRSDLITMIVHDLKMPLSTILPSLESLLAGDMGVLSPSQAHFVQMARRSGQDMLTLIQNLLDVARLEEGRLTLQKERIAPRSWVQSVVTNFSTQASTQKKQLSAVTTEEPMIIDADVSLLTRALGNLIANALRHTPAGVGEVTVTAFQDGNQLAVEVRDNGEGISEEEQKRIFEKFTQGAGQKVTLRTGSGLGLTFCKMVIEAHGGRISVFSNKGQGSLFTFHLPLVAEADLASMAPQSRPAELATKSAD